METVYHKQNISFNTVCFAASFLPNTIFVVLIEVDNHKTEDKSAFLV